MADRVGGGVVAPGDQENRERPGATVNLFVGDLPQRIGELAADRELWVACASGYRAAIAASFLDRAGLPVRLVADGGVPEWLARCFPRQRAT